LLLEALHFANYYTPLNRRERIANCGVILELGLSHLRWVNSFALLLEALHFANYYTPLNRRRIIEV
ncbi:MAG: hypothetical protein ACI35T_01560, partial [Alistipes sp.]